jgi:hypothetical protein
MGRHRQFAKPFSGHERTMFFQQRSDRVQVCCVGKVDVDAVLLL